MRVVAKIFNSNYHTYKLFYKDAVAGALKKDNIEIDPEAIDLEVENIKGGTVQAQRSPRSNQSRTIRVYCDDKLKYIIGISNTGYDEDKRLESEAGIKKYNYGNKAFHSNSYLCQGINKIFELYYDEKAKNEDLKLFFYLLDVDKATYPNNLSNCMTYRMLYTIGFEILNIEGITFDCFVPLGFSKDEIDNIGYKSFNKFANDCAALSQRNMGNMPAYLRCIDKNYDIDKNDEYELDEATKTESNEYIYTFKALGAQSYDSFLKMWTLQTLAEKEHKNLKFLFSKEKFNYRHGQSEKEVKYTDDFPETIVSLINKIGIDITYETSEEVRQQFEREKKQYEKAKANKDIRNQELFRNNIREKGVETKCYLCGCEIETILQAAHLWGVSEIKNASKQEINDVLNNKNMRDIVDENDERRRDDFYKRYVLANSGDNGIWLCKNHHGLFDGNFYCFDSESGKVLIRKDAGEEAIEFFDRITNQRKIPNKILTPKTKIFLDKNIKNKNIL